MPDSPLSPSPASSALPPFLRALGSRNYRLFFGGQTISLVGTWMTATASLWLGYHLEGSALLLGVVGFSGQAPIFSCRRWRACGRTAWTSAACSC